MGGLPLVYTLPFYLFATFPESWKCKGLRKADSERDDILLKVDPYSGYSVGGSLKIQANYLFTREWVSGAWAGNQTEILIPISYLYKESRPSDSSYDTIQTFQGWVDLSKIIKIVSAVVGSVLIVAGIVYYICASRYENSGSNIAKQQHLETQSNLAVSALATSSTLGNVVAQNK